MNDGSPVLGAGVIVVVALAIIGGIVGLVAANFSHADSTHIACVWNGGPFDNRTFKEANGSGSGRQYAGMFSTVTEVPTGIRQYRVSQDPAQGDTPTADQVHVSVRGLGMDFEPTVLFTINTANMPGTNKPYACDLVERHLRQFGATDFDEQGGHWQFGFLNERVRPVLNDVATRVLGQHDPVNLRYNTDGERDKAAEEIGKGLSEAVIANLGQGYFCAPSYSYGQPAEACGTMKVQLPEPKVSAADEAILAAPQRERVAADTAIAAAQQQTRQAKQLAYEREAQVDAAKRQGSAESAIAQAKIEQADRQATLDTAKCRALAALGQNCALVIAAEKGDFPTVIGADAVVSVTQTTTAKQG